MFFSGSSGPTQAKDTPKPETGPGHPPLVSRRSDSALLPPPSPRIKRNCFKTASYSLDYVVDSRSLTPTDTCSSPTSASVSDVLPDTASAMTSSPAMTKSVTPLWETPGRVIVVNETQRKLSPRKPQVVEEENNLHIHTFKKNTQTAKPGQAKAASRATAQGQVNPSFESDANDTIVSMTTMPSINTKQVSRMQSFGVRSVMVTWWSLTPIGLGLGIVKAGVQGRQSQWSINFLVVVNMVNVGSLPICIKHQ